MNIRRAVVKDVDAIFDVRTCVIENHMTEEQLAEMGVTRESTRQVILDDSLPIWCAFVEDKMAGFVSIKIEDSELFALFVRPECEGKGIGGALHDVAVNWWCEHHPNEALNLNTEQSARAFTFYQKRGWVLVAGEPKSHMLAGDVLMQLNKR
jgi:GNAT superfamily N-acetyltransferase